MTLRGRSSLTTAGRAFLRQQVGIWPVFEAKNKITGFGGALRARRYEDSEVTRLRGGLGSLPRARCATVIATYRRPQSLLRAVESALHQTIEDQVIMVVDDGGGLPELPSDPRLFSVSLRHNCGILGVVRNVGMRLTRSEFIAILDDDNEWYPWHLQSHLEVLEDPSVRLSYSDLDRIYVDGSVHDLLSQSFEWRAFVDAENFIDSNAIVMRRRTGPLFSRIPRSKSTFPKEDWELAHRVARNRRAAHERIAHVARPTVRYLLNSQSYFSTWDTSGRP